MCVLVWVSFSLSYLELVFLDLSIHVFHQVFGHYLFFFLFFWDSHNVYTGVPQVRLTLVTFFFLQLRFGNFNCPVFKFTDFFLVQPQICSSTPPVSFIYCCFSSNISVSFFMISIFYCYFHFLRTPFSLCSLFFLHL